MTASKLGDVCFVVDKLEHDLPYWEDLFQKQNFPGMDLVEATAYPQSLEERREAKKAFRQIRREFLNLLLEERLNDLKEAGCDDSALLALRRGVMPENFNIHIKIPFDYTGQVDFSNLVFMQSLPYHNEIHRFINMQMAGLDVNARPRKLYIPVPVGMVYLPHTEITGSGGKNKSDRSVTAGMTTSFLQNMALKSMRGGRG